MSNINKPNLTIPLASTYNERGIQGNTNIQASVDQRKLNAIYRITQNPVGGGGSFDLARRPGVTIHGVTLGGATQTPYLIGRRDSSLTNDPSFLVGNGDIAIFQKTGSVIFSSSSSSGDITIVSSASNSVPMFADETRISNVGTSVIQIGLSAGGPLASRTFFSSTFLSWTEITSAGYTALSATGKMEHMDGYAFLGDITGKLGNSDLNSISSWTAGNFITKLITQDYPVGLAKLGNQILFFGQQSVEAYFNNGNPTGSPLSPIKQLQNNVGLVATWDGHYSCRVGAFLYYVGRRGGGYTSKALYAYDQTNHVKVSSNYIDSILGEATIFGVYAIGCQGRSAISIRLTANTASSQRCLIFFPDWKEWFEWTSSVFFPTSDIEYSLGLVSASKGNRVYKFTATDNWQDDGTSYQYATQFKLPERSGSRKHMVNYGVIGDTARTTNNLLVEFSDDDYQTFYTAGTIPLTASLKTLYRGGTYRDRAVRLSNTNALETRLQSFTALVK